MKAVSTQQQASSSSSPRLSEVVMTTPLEPEMRAIMQSLANNINILNAEQSKLTNALSQAHEQFTNYVHQCAYLLQLDPDDVTFNPDTGSFSPKLVPLSNGDTSTDPA